MREDQRDDKKVVLVGPSFERNGVDDSKSIDSLSLAQLMELLQQMFKN
jgi:hypothetical protein